MKKVLKWAGITFIVLVVIAIIARGESPTDTNESVSSESEVKEVLQDGEDKVANMSALEQMEIAFIGSPSKEKIKEKLDLALQFYSTDITEENYSRAASSLIALRKESKVGVTEMEILDYMIGSYVEGTNMSFPDMAGISFSALELNPN